MGLATKIINKSVATNEQIEPLTLTIQEYEFLFGLIKNATFKGEYLELVYNLTVKLQDQYLKLKAKSSPTGKDE